MKRVVAIILMCLLAANVGGVSITHHRCGKVSQYITFNGKKKNHKCCCKGSEHDKGACKTKVLKVKVDDVNSVAKHIVVPPQLVSDVIPQPFVFSCRPASVVSAVDMVPRIHPPPLISPVRQHVLYQVFLI